MIQTEIFDDRTFWCELHPEQSMKLICYSEKCPYKRRFICLQCHLEEKKEQDNIATLQDFIKDPISFLDKKKEYSQQKRYNCDELLIQIDEFKVMLQKVHQDFLLQLYNLKVQLSNKIESDLSFQVELLKRLRIHEFQQQLILIGEMDSFQGTQEFALLEQQLNNIILSWKECCQQIANEQAKSYQDVKYSLLIKMDNKLKLEKSLYDKLAKQFIGLFDQQTEIPTLIHQEISNGKQIEYQLLYQGTKDGLLTNIYWEKCNLQSHLLTIITLKNGNIFGGYSPCQLILKDYGYWTADNAKQSFIFQQNKQEIYKLKKKSYAIYCWKEYGPYFGNDFQVGHDFKSLKSKLGSEYDDVNYNVQNQNTHLIGDKDIDIVECKVFKITFQ